MQCTEEQRADVFWVKTSTKTIYYRENFQLSIYDKVPSYWNWKNRKAKLYTHIKASPTKCLFNLTPHKICIISIECVTKTSFLQSFVCFTWQHSGKLLCFHILLFSIVCSTVNLSSGLANCILFLIQKNKHYHKGGKGYTCKLMFYIVFV